MNDDFSKVEHTYIENKYEYYGTATEEYYTLGAVSKNSTSASYTIKLDKVPNKDYYFTIVKEVEFLSNNEKEFLSSNNASISKGTKINKLPDREQHLIMARYIHAKKWEEICVDMNYSWTQLHAIHSKALKIMAS